MDCVWCWLSCRDGCGAGLSSFVMISLWCVLLCLSFVTKLSNKLKYYLLSFSQDIVIFRRNFLKIFLTGNIFYLPDILSLSVINIMCTVKVVERNIYLSPGCNLPLNFRQLDFVFTIGFLSVNRKKAAFQKLEWQIIDFPFSLDPCSDGKFANFIDELKTAEFLWHLCWECRKDQRRIF